jgi:hypothetical protein
VIKCLEYGHYQAFAVVEFAYSIINTIRQVTFQKVFIRFPAAAG